MKAENSFSEGDASLHACQPLHKFGSRTTDSTARQIFFLGIIMLSQYSLEGVGKVGTTLCICGGKAKLRAVSRASRRSLK
jgi:hypothetical protein